MQKIPSMFNFLCLLGRLDTVQIVKTTVETQDYDKYLISKKGAV